jgi:hypothetical protein
MLRIAPDKEKSRQLWLAMPPLEGMTRVGTPIPGKATVLATFGENGLRAP